jgi:hypothetical protein
MSEAELQTMIDEMFEMFGQLPNPDQEPRRFKYYIQLYLHVKSRS